MVFLRTAGGISHDPADSRYIWNDVVGEALRRACLLTQEDAASQEFWEGRVPCITSGQTPQIRISAITYPSRTKFCAHDSARMKNMLRDRPHRTAWRGVHEYTAN